MAINSLQSKIGNTDEYLVTEGLAMIAPIDAQDQISGAFRNVGSLTDLTISHTFTEVEIKETQTGEGNTAASFITDKEVEVSFTIKDFSAENFQLLSLGDSTAVPAAAGEAGTQTVDPEGYYRIGKLITSSTFVLTDDGATITYEEGKNYEVDDGGYFFIYSEADQTAKSAANIIGAATVVDYTYDVPAQTQVDGFTNNTLNNYFSFDAVNKLTGEHVLVELPKVAINPSDAVPFLSPDAEGTATITAKAIISKAFPDFGSYRVSKL